MSKRKDQGTLEMTPHQELFEDRWSGYDKQSGILQLSSHLSPEELKGFAILKGYGDDFLQSISHDISLAVWDRGTILFEEGSYLDLAFFVVTGGVEVFLQKSRDSTSQPIFNNSFLSTAAPEEQNSGAGTPALERPSTQGKPITYLTSMDFNLPRGDSVHLGPGEIFGEIGTLNGWPQSVTARTSHKTTLLQIRLPALRKMKQESVELKKHLDALYRERALFAQLATTPLFKALDDPIIKQLAEQVELVSCKPGQVICNEGAPLDALYLVRSGFFNVSQHVGQRNATVSYLSKGMTFGEVEYLIDDINTWQTTITSVGFTELVKIKLNDVARICQDHPTVPRLLWNSTVLKIKEAGFTRKNLDKADLIEFSLSKGLVQGNSILVIDLDVCTRCDDCMRGCASTHGGRPRFIREGEKYDNFLITRSCYHCEDPVCLIGCPTGAIRRANVGDVVEIDDNLCIGCENCSRKCPYDAIIMHETGETWPSTAFPSYLQGKPRKVASKCDLCHTSDAGPACVNNCPHSCAFRVSSIDDFQQLLAIDKE